MVKVAVVGVGNCVSALVQGVAYYRQHPDAPGRIRKTINQLEVGDIEFTMAFDVDASKVGRPLREAIWGGRNNTLKLCELPRDFATCPVFRGPTLDGLGSNYRSAIEEAPELDERDCFKVAVDSLRGSTDVLVNAIPVGSEAASRWWAKVALEAGVAFVNTIPAFVCHDEQTRNEFKRRSLPLVGDDIKSQFGATLVHRRLASDAERRGYHIDAQYQLNFGGNMDFQNMLNGERLGTKKASKRAAVETLLGRELGDTCHISPTGYVPFLVDRKICYLNLGMTGFGGAPAECEVKLTVWDSPNWASCVADLVRIAYLAKKGGYGGYLAAPSAEYCKSPVYPGTDDDARLATDLFLARYPLTDRGTTPCG